MKNFLAIALIMFLSAAPSRLLAKGATTKVVIEGPNLSKPIEITDRKDSCEFQRLDGARDVFHPAGIQRERT